MVRDFLLRTRSDLYHVEHSRSLQNHLKQHYVTFMPHD